MVTSIRAFLNRYSINVVLVALLLSLLTPPLEQASASISSTVGVGLGNGLQMFLKTESGASSAITPSRFNSGTCYVGNVPTIDFSNFDAYTNCGVIGTNGYREGFSAFFRGYILAPATESVRFWSTNDDAVKVSINGNVVVDNWSDQGGVAKPTFNNNASSINTLSMTQGRIYPIEIYYHQNTQNATLKLYWSYPSCSGCSTQSTAQIIPQSQLGTSSADLATGCAIGMTEACPASSAMEIKNLTGTNTDGLYWITSAGISTQVYSLMNSSLGGGGWQLAMKGKSSASTFGYDSAYWTDLNTLNANTTPSRISTNDIDAKYSTFYGTFANQMMTLFPNYSGATYGGAYPSAGYGFAWSESITGMSAWTGPSSGTNMTSGPQRAGGCRSTASTLRDMFGTSNRCLIRQPNALPSGTESYLSGSAASYYAVGSNLFASQYDVRFWGINYGMNSTTADARVRWGFGFNENGSGNESSNDVIGGIGIAGRGTNLTAGTYMGCCSATGGGGQAGVSGNSNGSQTNMAFELYVRENGVQFTGSSEFRATAGTSATFNLTATRSSGATSTIWNIPGLMSGLTLDTTTGVLTASNTLAAGTYYETATALDNTGARATFPFKISITPGLSETDTALTLSGAQYLSASNESSFDISSGTTFTLEAWIKPSVINTSQIIIGKDQQYSLYLFSNGSFGMNFFTTDRPTGDGGDTSIFRANSARANEWQHVAVVRNGTTITGFINGQQANSYTFSSSTGSIKSGDNPFVIGGYATNNQAFTGQLDQVRVWSTARTASELQAGMNTFLPASQTGLIASYGFNESAGSRIFDNASSASWNTDLTLNGGSILTSQIAETSTSGAYSVVTFRRSYLTAFGGWKSGIGARSVTALIVSGGGGGGYNSGGGGGGGGLLEQNFSSLAIYETVTVGMGGVGSSSSGVAAATGFSSIFKGSSVAGGNAGTIYSTITGGAGVTTVTGTSGSGGSGTNSSSVAGSTGGSGILSSISGTSTRYVGGGGGGGWDVNTNGGGASAGGGGAGGITSARTGSSGTGNTGGGGGASSKGGFEGGNGGSGIVIIRWIIATSPTYTAPSTIDTTTAGRSYSFRATGSADSPLTRNFIWQSSTDTGTTWSTIQSSTSDSYTISSADVGTSGIKYQYRFIVTDSDTAGLSISDTSTIFYLIVNRHPTITPPTEISTSQIVNLDASSSSSYSGAGSTWNDLSGQGAHANLGITSGGPVVSGFSSGVTCSAPSFSTTNGGVFNFSGNITAPRNCAWIPNTRYTDVGETYTVQMWVKPASDSHAAWTGIISTPWTNGNKINFSIFYNGTTTGSNQNVVGGYFDGSSWFMTDALPVTTNAWNHLAIVSMNRSLTLYINGSPTSALSLASASGAISGASKGVLIGRRWDDNQTFNGAIGNVKIFSTGISVEQVKQEYYQTSGRFITTATAGRTSTKNYAASLVETFTVNNGTGSKTFSFTPNNRTGISWDTSTANSAKLTVSDSLNVGTYYETITATDSVSASTTLGLTITVNKSRQASLKIGQYDAYPGVSTYPINVYGGSGSGAVTRSLTDSGTAQCVLTGAMFLTASRVGKCSVQAVKAGDSNYYSETGTATIYWIQWSDAYATRVASTPTEIVLNHQTQIIKYSYDTLTATSFADSSGVAITSASVGQVIRLIGTGFVSTDDQTTINLANGEMVEFANLTINTTDPLANYIQFTIPSGVTTDVVGVSTRKGTIYTTATLTITP